VQTGVGVGVGEVSKFRIPTVRIWVRYGARVRQWV